MYRAKGKFKESDVTYSEFSQFDKVWLPVRERFAMIVLGNVLGDFTMPSWTWSMLRGFCSRRYETAARSLKKSVDDIKNLEGKLEQAVAGK